jgi:hypothetical protein
MFTILLANENAQIDFQIYAPLMKMPGKEPRKEPRNTPGKCTKMISNSSQPVKSNTSFLHALAFFAVVLSFFVPFEVESFLFRSIVDLLHFPAGVLLAALAYRLFTKTHQLPVRNAAFLVASGLVIVEALQPFSGRSFSFSDMGASVLGVGFWWSLSLRNYPARLTLAVALVAALLILSRAAIFECVAIAGQKYYFPIIYSREMPFIDYRLRVGGQRAKDFSSRPLWSLHNGQSRSKALSASSPFELHLAQDWSGYEELNLEIDSVSFERLFLRIDDFGNCTDYGDRFNASYDLSPGKATIRVSLAEIQSGPSNRNLDLSFIRRLLIFSYSENPQFSVGEIRLRGVVQNSALREDF